ncbi:MAG: response regulator transcription factor [Thiobacillaceae bacterium]|jgi:FixJ family two-component response regulator|nr:response regulator transcription factor [Thiobacillaceae bacterium]
MSATYHPVIHIVDDDAAVREALCALLGSVHLPARAHATPEDFLAAAGPDMAGCLLLDVRMPGMGGLELQRLLPEHGITLPVIIITGHGDVPMAVRAMKAGAVDFIEKPFNDQDLLDRIQAALATDAEAHRQRAERREATRRLGQLTAREQEILALLVSGQPSKKIAAALGISERTVDVHRYNIMHKSGTRTLAELIQIWGLLHPGAPPETPTP